MKKIILFISFFIATVPILRAQSANWAWAKRAGTVNADIASGISVDAGGNSFVAGSFRGATIAIGTVTLTNTDNTGSTRDIYIAKYNSSGNVVWAKSAGGLADDEPGSIHVNEKGNIFLTGGYDSSPISFGTVNLTNATGSGITSDVFIVKYNSLGNVLWAKSAGGPKDDSGFGIQTDTSGNCYVAGSIQSAWAAFGFNTLINADASGNTNDIFIVKLDSLGDFIWSNRYGGTSEESGSCISTDPNGNSFVSGYFSSASVVFGASTLTTAGSWDVFMAKFDDAGTVMWAKRAGGTASDYGTGIDIDTVGNIFLTGQFDSPSIIFGSTTLTNAGNRNLFLVKYNSLGNPVWAKKAGGSASDFSNAITVDAKGNSYITGNFYSASITFGSITLINTTAITSDIFTAKYDPAGSAVWALKAGGSGGYNDERGSSIGVDAAGSAYISGFYSCPAITFGTTTLSNSGDYDMFAAKISSICNLSAPPICLVTVDSVSKYNNIVWDKTPYTNVDSFIIFREITTNNYKQIGAVHFSHLSLFEDTVRTKYFPNTGDPNMGTYRYKIQILDTCGNYTSLGPYHNVIYITNNSGTFSWPQLYTIEGSPNPVNNYVLMRDDNNTGSFNAVSSVAGSQQSVTDPAYAAWQSTAVWRVETQWGISCTPMSKDPLVMAINKTRSNSYKTFITNTDESEFAGMVSIYPNPSSGIISVSSTLFSFSKIEVCNLLGEICFSFRNDNSRSVVQLDIAALPVGMYYLKIFFGQTTAVKKISITH